MESEDGRTYYGISLNTDQLQADAKTAMNTFKNISAGAIDQGRIMDKSLSKTGELIDKAFDGKKIKVTTEELQLQIKAVELLEESYKKAKAEFDKTNISTSDPEFLELRKKNSQWFKSIGAELNEEKDTLKKMVVEQENVNKSADSYLTIIRHIKDEMTGLVMSGEKDTDEYRELEEQLSKVGTAYREVQKEQKNLTSGAAQLSGVLNLIQGASGAFAAGQGILSLFVKDNERLMAIQTKLQAAMSITIGLQSIANTLHQTSSFRMVTARKATDLWNASIKSLNTQLGISVGLSKALMIGGIGVLIAGVTLLVSKYKSWKREQEEINRLNEIYNNALKSASEEGAKAAAKETHQLDLLYKATQDTAKSQSERKKAAEELQKMYPSYLGNMSQEEILAGRAAGAYDNLKTSIIASAKARAVADKIAENSLKILDLESQKSELERKRDEAEIRKLKEEQLAKETRQLMSDESYLFQKATIDAASKRVEKYNDEINKTSDEIGKLNDANQKLANSINIEDFLFDPSENSKNRDLTDISSVYNRINEIIKQSASDLESARISIMKDGLDKRLAQIDSEKKQMLDAIDKEQKELEEKYKSIGKKVSPEQIQVFEERRTITTQQADKNIADAEKENADQVAEIYRNLSDIYLSEEEKKLEAIRRRYEEERKELAKLLSGGSISGNQYNDLLAKNKAAETKETNDYLISQFGSYYEQRAALTEKWEAILAAIPEKYHDEVNKQREKEFSSIDKEYLKTTKAIEKLFGSMKNKSVAEMRATVAEAEKLIGFLKADEFDENNSFGFDLATWENIKKTLADTPDLLDYVIEKVKELEEATDKTEIETNSLAENLQKLFSGDLNEEQLKQVLGEIGDKIQSVTQLAGMFADTLKDIGELADSDALSSIADGLSQVLDVAGSVMSGVQAGSSFGPVGAIVGGVLGLASSVTGILANNKKHREELRKQIQDNQTAAYLGELELNQLYRERYEWARKIGEAQLSHIKRQGEELKKQAQENQSDQDSLWKKLLNTEYKSGEHFQKTGLFGWGKGKVVEEWTSLAGKTWEEIEMFAAQGKLSEEGMKFYEALKAAKEEGDDLVARQAEYLESVREAFTGSTYDGLVDGIVSAFKVMRQEGKSASQMIADSFGSLMEGALESALKMATDERMRQWYESFVDMAMDGLSKEEIAELNAKYEAIINGLSDELAALEAATGIKFGKGAEEARQGMSGLQYSMTQESVSELIGINNANLIFSRNTAENTANMVTIQEQTRANVEGIRTTMAAFHEIGNNLLTEVREINTNTKRLEKIEGDMSSAKNSLSNIETRGITLKN